MKKAVLLAFFALSAPLSAAEPAPVASSATVHAVSFSGNTAFDDGVLLRVTGLTPGTTFQAGDEEVAAGLVKSHYQKNGYLDVASTASAVSGDAGWTVRIRVEEGPLYRFGATTVEGVEKLPERILLFERRYKEGEPYVRSKLFETQSALFGSGFFDDVSITASTTAQKTADISVRVKERPFKWLKGGVGWGSEEHQRATLILEHNNLARRAYHGQIAGTWSAIWREYSAEFMNPYLFGTRTEFRNVASWRKEFREGYDYERTRGETSLGKELRRNLRGTVGFRLERNIVFNVAPEVQATTPEQSDARVISVSANWDNANDFFFPTRGARTRATLERFGGFLGGGLDLHRAAVESYHYTPLYRPVSGALALRVGGVEPFAATADVPIYNRFFIGGANSIRGYNERDVGPHTAEGDPLGARRLLGATVETRFPLYWKFRGAVFADGGQVADHWAQVWPRFWKYSAGAGIRFVTPVGPFRLDWGYKLNRDKGDNDPWRFHFSLGESF